MFELTVMKPVIELMKKWHFMGFTIWVSSAVFKILNFLHAEQIITDDDEVVQKETSHNSCNHDLAM